MRSIRNAAVAGVTALAVSLSGVTVFAADGSTASTTTTTTTDTPKGPQNGDTEGSSKSASLSSQLSKKYDGEKAIKGTDAFGSSKLPNDKRPAWLNIWEGFTIAGIVLTVLTNLIAPAYNYLKFNGII
ncbi:MAG: hypothetical protein SPK00_04020 [Corynebacterium glucuronolyticum]|nr:hypothetical protein [Mycobacteriaceae bacterium]MDY5833904.1 hypothetical protein [Corynebacterium glucuronolyticum]